MSNRDWPQLSGIIENRRHILPVRVYFEDTDFSGFVYHTSYLRWCERGRSDLLRMLGIHHSGLMDGSEERPPAAFVVRSLHIDYLRPAKIDEVLEVVTECTAVGGTYITLHQEVMRGEEVLCRVSVKVVLINLEGRPVRLPPLIKELFEA
ncbi:MAG TPA: YbgC/FadM family acyl-CoA thioesterase [Hyphomicrobiales bacterium]|nr:YbgC/FadM family acyl-CoA thioesterase [Hyphomicrobiales bacterium]